MRPQKISEEQLTENMLEIIRSRGYEGSSLNDLALVGGLKKASLYHRYPGGKETLVQSVLDHYTAWLQEHVFDVLAANKKKTKKKLSTALENIRGNYHEGASNCLYLALSMESGKALYGTQIAQNCNQWLKAFEKLGKDLGLKKKKAKQLAQDSLIRIQGALVMSNIMNDSTLFLNALDEIRESYLGK
jgi:AcrR family transcriptional regulator